MIYSPESIVKKFMTGPYCNPDDQGDTNNGNWQCNKCIQNNNFKFIKCNKNGGWKNLENHVKACISDWEKQMDPAYGIPVVVLHVIDIFVYSLTL
jgi:hypothetical protein